MISNTTFQQTHDLGVWQCQTPTSLKRFNADRKMHPKSAENIYVKVNETTQFKLYPINSSSVTPDLTTPLAFTKDPEEIYQGLLKTKTLKLKDFILLMFTPARTHTFKDLCLDTAAPFTRRSLADKESVAGLVTSVFIDITTLAFRVLTSLPRAAYNFCFAQQHPLKGAFDKDVEAVYVKCKKTWEIEGNFCEKLSNHRPEKITNEHTSTFFWRIDLQPLLHNRFEFDGKEHSLKSNTDETNNVFTQDPSACLRFCFENISKTNAIKNSLMRDNPATLIDTSLQEIVKAPTVVHI
ncbi:MAG: hypothetical protein S4CHLAM123_10830 [Chlamydiales bacterium]|nr:hypothetical protein [Chlamydiales bacterium]